MTFNIGCTPHQGAWENWRAISARDEFPIVGNRNNVFTDRIRLDTPLAERQRCDAGDGRDGLCGGLPLMRLPRVASWANSVNEGDNVEGDCILLPCEDAITQPEYENIAFQFKPSIATWFGLSSEQEVVRRIRACKYSSWDPIAESAVGEGSFVLADTTFAADLDEEYIQECARGIILACDHSLVCTIGFLNRGEERLTRVTMPLPDDRILQAIQDDSDYSDLYSEASD